MEISVGYKNTGIKINNLQLATCNLQSCAVSSKVILTKKQKP